MGKERELSNCGFVKTILMLLVILGHACAFWSGHWFTDNPALPSRGLNALFEWLNSFHIYAFALVSGYIFTYKIIRGVPRVCSVYKKQGKKITGAVCVRGACVGHPDIGILL